MLLSASAPGRVCLLGEHCDWAGGSCLVAPLDRRVRVSVAPAERFIVRSDFGVSRLGAEAHALPSDPNRYVAAVIRALRAAGWAVPPLSITVTSELPHGRGFSSSAALCVATARAVATLLDRTPDPTAIAELAYVAEHDHLGVGCGRMDQLACAYAEPLFIRWNPSFLVRPLPCDGQILAAAYPEGRPAAEILRALAAGIDRARPTIHRWGALAEAGAEQLMQGDLPAMGAGMNEAQRLYEALDLPELCAPWLAEAVRAARDAGALGAKFTGAGGDRSMVAIFADRAGWDRGAEVMGALGAEVI